VQTVGLAGALSAAVFGLADWSYTGGRARRVGAVHGLTNVLIAGLYAASLAARQRGHRGAGIALSSAGFSLLLFSSWLGGELVYRYGVGVNREAFQERPEGWRRALDDWRLGEGQMRRVEVEGTAVLLARQQGRLHAIGDTCTHMGCSLSEGTLHEDQVQCPCHGSRFRLSDGQVMQGPATVAVPAYETRVQTGGVEVRLPAPAPAER
jgi:nitrite reductase/ring-hydroxylating ferredoxin subunit